MFEFLPDPETVCYRGYVDAVTRYVLFRDGAGRSGRVDCPE